MYSVFMSLREGKFSAWLNTLVLWTREVLRLKAAEEDPEKVQEGAAVLTAGQSLEPFRDNNC